MFVLQREERDALVARQIALSLEREERQRERELQEMMRLQLRLGDEAMQQEFEKRMQEEKDEVDNLRLMKPLCMKQLCIYIYFFLFFIF